MQELTPQQQKKLLRLAKIADNGEISIVEEINLLDDRIDTVDEKATKALEREIVNGVDGKDGIDGKDGVDGKNGSDGKNGLNGKDGKDGINGEDGSPDTVEDIALKLNKKEQIIEQKVIIGLEESLNKKVSDGIDTFGKGAGSGGIFLYSSGVKKGKINTLNFAGSTYSKVNGLDTLTFSGGGGVTSVSNVDSSLNISPTTGDVIASINTSNSNTWYASQLFGGGLTSLNSDGSLTLTAGGIAHEFRSDGNIDFDSQAIQIGRTLPFGSGGLIFLNTSTGVVGAEGMYAGYGDFPTYVQGGSGYLGKDASTGYGNLGLQGAMGSSGLATMFADTTLSDPNVYFNNKVSGGSFFFYDNDLVNQLLDINTIMSTFTTPVTVNNDLYVSGKSNQTTGGTIKTISEVLTRYMPAGAAGSYVDIGYIDATAYGKSVIVNTASFPTGVFSHTFMINTDYLGSANGTNWYLASPVSSSVNYGKAAPWLAFREVVGSNRLELRLVMREASGAPEVSVSVTAFGDSSITFTPISTSGSMSVPLLAPHKMEDWHQVQSGKIGTQAMAMEDIPQLYTMPTTANDYIEFATITNGNFAALADIWLNVQGNGYAQSKRYIFTLAYDGTANTWQKVLPMSDTGPYGGNDTDLDIKIDQGTATLRVRRVSGATAAVGFVGLIIGGTELTGGDTIVTRIRNTGSGSAPTVLYAPTTLSQKGGVSKTRAGTALTTVNMGGILFDHYADVGNIGTGEDDLYSDTLPASILGTNGDKITAEYTVIFASSATATRQVKAYFGGTSILASGALTLASGGSADVFITIIRESSSVVRVRAEFVVSGITLQPIVTYTRITGLTLTNTQILKITGEAAGVGAATDDVVAKIAFGEWKPVFN
jgi:Collagen triple helix repeat (20 copies)